MQRARTAAPFLVSTAGRPVAQAGARLLSTVTSSSAKPAAAPSVDKLHALMYTFVDGILEKRAPHRAAHLAYLQQYADDGRLLAGGAWEDASGGMIVLRTATADDVHRFAHGDPYVKAGLVTRHEVRPWLVVIGTAKKEPSS